MQIDRPISIALILFIILVLMFFFVVPEYKIFKRLQADLAQKIAEYNAEFDYFSEITSTYNKIKERKDDITKIDSALPNDPNYGQLVYFIQKKASEKGLIVKSIFLSKSSPINQQTSTKNNISKNVNELGFSLSILGDYSSLENFIISLEKSSHLFEVTSISFGSSEVASKKTSSSSSQPDTTQPAPKTVTTTQTPSRQIYTFSLLVETHSY